MISEYVRSDRDGVGHQEGMRDFGSVRVGHRRGPLTARAPKMSRFIWDNDWHAVFYAPRQHACGLHEFHPSTALAGAASTQVVEGLGFTGYTA